MIKRAAYVLLMMFACLSAGAQQMIRGHVTDERTGEAVPSVSVQYVGHGIGVVADADGNYAISRHLGWVLTFTAVGYLPTTVMVNANVKDVCHVTMKADNTLLKEVTVKTKRSRYRRKENPAVIMMRKVIAARKRSDLSNFDYYRYRKYQKLTFALNDITQKRMENPKNKKIRWLMNQIETCPYNGKLVLPISLDETVSQKIYRKNPRKEKTIILGTRSEGINHIVQTGDVVNQVIKDIFTDIDIYENQIRFLQYQFTSPIGDGAISFYRYYIEDTLYVGKDKCFHLHFLPNNPQDFGFRGDLYVMADSSWLVKRCEMTIPKQSDVNFVDNMQVVQEFSRLPNGEWVLTTDDMFTELRYLDVMESFSMTRNTRMTDFSFSEIPAHLFKGKADEVKVAGASSRSERFWEQNRELQLTKSEANMEQFVNDLENIKGYKYILAGIKILTESFIETGTKEHPSKVDIGPVNTFITSNFIDGLRTRLSAQTTANLDSNLFLKGYIARGWGSHKTYYNGEVTWSFNKKEYMPREFPIRNLTVSSTYDVMSPSDKFLQGDKDNVFTSFKWADTKKMMFYNRQSITAEREEVWGLRTTLSLNAEENEAAGDLYFIPLSESRDNPLASRKIRTTELRAELRFAPGETFVHNKKNRLNINRDAPIITLSHTLGLKDVLGADYAYNYTELSFFKRFWLSSWGKFDVHAKGGIQWNQVPFPLLIMPETNLSYLLQNYTFEAINNMEFPTDRFASLYLNWDMNGKIFNRIPLLRELKWREWVSVRCLWGGLSDKNNPLLSQNAGSSLLMYLPDGCYVIDPHHPYWEISLGVHNIFKLLQVEYVRRMNYNYLPTAHKHGVRFRIKLSF
jgi:hypothetical protein